MPRSSVVPWLVGAIAVALPHTTLASPDGGFDPPPTVKTPPTTFTQGLFTEDGTLDPVETDKLLLTTIPQPPMSSIALNQMMTFDSTCWYELYGGEPAPPAIELPVDEDQCFLNADGELICWNSEEVATHWAEVQTAVDDYEIAETSPYLPYTDGHFDPRYWDEQALEEFENCMGSELPEGIFSVATTAPPTVADCLEEAQLVHGDVCLAVTDGLCTNLDYFESWCGRLEVDANGNDPSWSCIAAVQAAAQTIMNDPAHPPQRLLIPERMWTINGDELHVFDHANGPRYLLGEATPMTTVEAFTTDPVESAWIAAADALERAQWDANDAVANCEEYAYDRFYDPSEVEREAQAHRGSPRWIFDRVFSGAAPMVAPAYGGNSTPIVFDMRQRMGSALENASTSVESPTVAWSSVAALGGKEYGDGTGDARLYEGEYGYGPTHLIDFVDMPQSTFKNVYAYLHALRQGPPPGFAPVSGASACEGWRLKQRVHYAVNPSWHDEMDQFAKQRGFTDEDLAHLQLKQDELWLLFLRYIEEEDVSVRQSLLAQIDEHILEGVMLGCVPMGASYPPSNPLAMSACDWSPSFFSEGLHSYVAHQRKAAYDECVDELEEGTLDGQALLDDIPPYDGLCNLGIPTATCQDLTDLHNALTSIDPLTDHEALRAFVENRRTYLALREDALLELPREALGDARHAEFAKSGNQHFFGAGTNGSMTYGLLPAEATGESSTVCEAAPYLNLESGAGQRAATLDIDAMSEFVSAHADPNAHEPLPPVQDGFSTPSGGFVSMGVRSSGHLHYDPTNATTTAGISFGGHATFSPSVRFAYQAGPFTLSATIGAAVSVGADLQAAYSIGSPGPDSELDGCEDPTVRKTFQLTRSSSVNASAFLEIAGGIGIPALLWFEVGVGGRLVLLNASFPMSLSLNWDLIPLPPKPAIGLDENGMELAAECPELAEAQQGILDETPNGVPAPAFWGDARADLTMDLLTGTLYVFARIGSLFGTIAEVKYDWAQFRRDKTKRLVLSEDMFSAADFCRRRQALDVYTVDPLLCRCQQAGLTVCGQDYCEGLE